MTKLFFSYGGRANDGRLYYPYKAIAHSATQAIAIINTWKSYGRKSSDSPDDRIVVNEVTKKKIQALFADGLGTYPNGDSRSYVGVRTTGCGAWEIGFTYALADTIQEHERIRNELNEIQEAARKQNEREIKRRRKMALCACCLGWYHVELTYTAYVFARHGNDHLTNLTFSGDVIAGSGIEAYNKAVSEIMNNPMTYHGDATVVQAIPDASSDDFSFTFLDEKTTKEWEKMKENNTK